jgi:hypothetical protein
MYTHLLSPTSVTCPAHLTLLDLIARKISSNREEREWKHKGLDKHREAMKKQLSYLKRRISEFGYYL